MPDSPNQVFLLNVGNTNAEYAIAHNGNIGEVNCIPTKELDLSLIPSDIPVAAACVVPSFMEKLKSVNNSVFEVKPGISCGIDFSGFDISTMGADRLANLIYLAETGPSPALCIDFGTAVTFEALGPGKEFKGGVILPGRMLQRKALNDFTAMIPYVNFYHDIPEIGNGTVDSVRVGVDRGIIGSVKEIVERIRNLFPEESLRIVAAGGDAEFFLKYISGLEAAGNNCTLYGINKAWEYYINES